MLIPWMSSLPFHLPPPWICSALSFRQLLGKSGNFSQSTLTSSFDGFSASSPKHGVFHELPTIPGPTVFAKACHLNPDKLASAQTEFLKMAQ